MTSHDIIVIGTSAGGLAALQELVRELPRDLPAAILIVHHTAPLTPSILPSVLAQGSELEVELAADESEIHNGRIYIAPPDRHLRIVDGHLRLSQGPKENLNRPSVDTLFRSAALAFGSRVAAVVLTGTLDDGTAGLWAVKQLGGVTVIQDPNEAEYPDMPQSAGKYAQIDYCLPLTEIGPLLVRLANEPVSDKCNSAAVAPLELENAIAGGDVEACRSIEKLGKLTAFTCPNCRGSLWEIREGSFLRFRCAAGHGYTAECLIAARRQRIEDLLHEAIRATEENPTLCRYLSEHAREHNNGLAADHYLCETAENERRAHMIRQFLNEHQKSGALNQMPIELDALTHGGHSWLSHRREAGRRLNHSSGTGDDVLVPPAPRP